MLEIQQRTTCLKFLPRNLPIQIREQVTLSKSVRDIWDFTIFQTLVPFKIFKIFKSFWGLFNIFVRLLEIFTDFHQHMNESQCFVGQYANGYWHRRHVNRLTFDKNDWLVIWHKGEKMDCQYKQPMKCIHKYHIISCRHHLVTMARTNYMIWEWKWTSMEMEV